MAVPKKKEPRPVGRPDKYDPKFLKVMDKYLSEAVPENMDIPTIEGFALKIDVSIPSLHRWMKKYKEFRYAIRKLKITQKQHLLKTGIFGGKEVNPTIIALMLRVNHKMVETTKSESKVRVKGLPLLNAIHNNDSAQEATESQEEN